MIINIKSNKYEEAIIPLEACQSEKHFLNIDEDLRDFYLSSTDMRCLNLENANLSLGTLEGKTENIIVIAWQDCENFKPDDFTCATY